MMMRSFLLVMLIVPGIVMGQKISNQLQLLAQAERDFAALCKAEGFKKSFSEFFDPTVVYFAGGNQVVFHEFIAKEPDPKPEEDNGYMFWQPIYADISAANDFGYTTGPVYFYKSKKDEKPQGHMYYSSVWTKNAKGQWKVIMDLGVPIPGEPKEDLNLKTSANQSKASSGKGESNFEALTQLEKKYCESLNSTKKSFDKNYLSDEVRIHRINRYPYVGIKATTEITEDDRTHAYSYIGGRIATSGDMGFTYGKASVDVTRDGKTTNYPCVYYRVWKKENNAWKIVLDVVGMTG